MPRLLLAATAALCLAVLPSLVQAQMPYGAVIPDSTLQRFGMRRAWVAAIPSAGNGARHVVLAGDALFMQTDRGVVHAVDAASGAPLWSTAIGRPSWPATRVAASDAYVAAANGANLFLLDRRNGQILWQQQLGGVPTAGPAIGAQEVFIPYGKGTMEAYICNRTNLVDAEPRRFSGTGYVATAPTALPNGVAWGTTSGDVNARLYDEAVAQFGYQTRGGVVAPIHHVGSMLLAGSLDGSVYALDDKRGTLLWRHPTSAGIRHQPVGIGEAVYAIPESGGLYKLNLKDGSRLWRAPGVMHFLAASDTRVFAADEIGRLMILDNQTGALQGTLSTAGMFDLMVINDQDGRVFVGNSVGMLTCLEPIVASTTEAAPGDAPTTPANPFEENPFGNGGDQPMPQQPAAEGNPFQ